MKFIKTADGSYIDQSQIDYSYIDQSQIGLKRGLRNSSLTSDLNGESNES